MSEKFSLKDELFNPQKVKYLASCIKKSYPKFDDELFIANSIKKFPELELKQRITCITNNLILHLPSDFDESVNIILKSLPPELDNTKGDNDFGDFIFAPLGSFIVAKGLSDERLELSLFALSEITKRFTMEDSIRYVINSYPQQSFAFLQHMAVSSNYHQRRLASEGLRPKLPWCIGIGFNYTQAIQILDILYYDNTRFVVRSVANHLNDIAKIDSGLVVQTLKKWQKENKQKCKKEWDFLVRHSLRTLVKKGDTQTLEFLGFNHNPKVKITGFTIKNITISLGEYLEFEFNISGDEKIIIDYKIIYPNNTQKVFKLKQVSLSGVESVYKKHLFRKMTTKKLYNGKYILQIQVNGNILQEKSFYLNDAILIDKK